MSLPENRTAAGKQGPARVEPSHRRSDAEARSTYANGFINGPRGPCRVDGVGMRDLPQFEKNRYVGFVVCGGSASKMLYCTSAFR
ncbi:hypothetical protein TNIN_272751 [Trichonephila inaurata madagascariensis]|uniref:Uncharacterized protein n=1 Tax=Trichonephila inaurata madagascariensis TaxID=2747483 RepID=A0A8X6Y3E4_9ARAC|nr:hypothetical protein TNIN_272751 [Trichonephila inaurata madagascariensis]